MGREASLKLLVFQDLLKVKRPSWAPQCLILILFVFCFLFGFCCVTNNHNIFSKLPEDEASYDLHDECARERLTASTNTVSPCLPLSDLLSYHHR